MHAGDTVHVQVHSRGALDVEGPGPSWRSLRLQVFQPPKHPVAFAVVVGAGAQVVAASLATLCFASMGFLSAPNRGAMATFVVLLFCFSGFAGGLVTNLVRSGPGGLGRV